MSKSNPFAPIIVTIIVLMCSTGAIKAQDLHVSPGNYAVHAMDPPLSSLLDSEQARAASRLDGALSDLLHRHLYYKGAGFNIADHLTATGARIGDIAMVHDNKIIVDLTITGRLKPALEALEEIEGIEIQASASTPTYHLISALVPVEGLLEMSMVPHLAAAYASAFETDGAGMIGHYKSEGSADNQAEEALDIDDLRRYFSSADGSGIELGCLSDSVDQVAGGISDSQNTSDLPENAKLEIISDTVDPDVHDEGRAMMELEYDIAPELNSLGFATAWGGQAAFAANITALSNAGMDIINDDIRYYDEPFFQNGVIAQAIDAYVDGGGIYFTSAGNYGNLSYQGAFSDGDGDDYHQYSGGDELYDWTISAGTAAHPTVARLGLQWTQLWGDASTDLQIDIYTLDDPPVLQFSSSENNINGNPYDELVINNSGAEVTLGIAIRRISGSVEDLTFKLVFFANGVWQGDFPEYPENKAGTAKPHGGMSSCIMIGAAPFYDRGVAEDFSSWGPHMKYFTDAGNPMNPYTTIKPDFMSIDRCNTSFFGTDIAQDDDALPNFGGTSAATPNAAAVAALMLDLAGGPGNLTASQVKTAMRLSAKDLGDAGLDPLYGYGRINALGAGVAARGPLSIEFSVYLNQFGDGSYSDSLYANNDIDTFKYSSNVYGTTTIDIAESHGEMDPMMVLFNQFGDSLIAIDYNSGPGDDARIELNATAVFPYIIEVLSETDFDEDPFGEATFELLIDGPDQVVVDRTANLDANGYDSGYSGTLATFGDSDYISYTAPTTGPLFIGLHPSGFVGYMRFYDASGALLQSGLVADGYSGGMSVSSVTAGQEYTIQIVSWAYSNYGSFEFTADFGRTHLFSDGFENGDMSAWSSTS